MPKYKHFTPKAKANRAFNQLRGIIDGIAVDDRVNDQEVTELDRWLADHQELGRREPFRNLVETLQDILADGVVTEEEIADMRWVCHRVETHEYFTYYDAHTADLQTLQGMCHGVLADGKIREEEVRGIAQWIGDHAHLVSYYPYDEMVSVLSTVLEDGEIDEEERTYLTAFFHEFVELTDASLTERINHLTREVQRSGVCALDPTIEAAGKRFVFTGKSNRDSSREDMEAIVHRYDGQTSRSVSGMTDYLVVGGKGNDCWAYACYGRKIEKAVQLRKKGKPVVIVHENDFWDWVEDQEE